MTDRRDVPTSRVPHWQQEQALAMLLWERGPMTARYKGEMTDKVHSALRKVLPGITRGSAAAVPGRLQARDLVAVEGDRAHATKVAWIGPDPITIEWKPLSTARAPRPSQQLAARVEVLEALVAAIPELVAKAVAEAMDEWTR